MCGIVGYVGTQPAQPILIAGLKRLEYRGYDSAGIATTSQNALHITKNTGRVAELETKLSSHKREDTCGISHTRWATHGSATDSNAHPHTDTKKQLAVVHNGVIENYEELRSELRETGITFVSETDTEVIAHLINLEHEHLRKTHQSKDQDLSLFVKAIQAALGRLRGAYGIAVIHRDHPNTIISARFGSPLVLGIGNNEHFIASDPSALVAHTNQVVYLEDGELVIMTPESFSIQKSTGATVNPDVKTITWTTEDASKGTFEHYMLKEIYEQPQTVEDAMRGHMDEKAGDARFGGLAPLTKDIASAKRIVITACGTSWHSALMGEYLFEHLARIPVEVEYASELRYRNAPTEDDTLFFCISQSGETADTLAALKEFKRRNVPTLGIVNVVGSTIAREAKSGVYLHAGPEIGVASTKAFTSQLIILTLLALHFGRLRHLSPEEGQRILAQLRAMPDLISKALKTEEQVKAIAQKYQHVKNMLYMGRGYNFPVALEGALKLKEVSYIHAEGYPAAEMKHGPIALVDPETPSIVINPKGPLYDKVTSNLEEIRARKGPVIAIASEGDDLIANKADDVIHVPHAEDFLQPLLTVIPLQLLAYHIALLRGCDVDKPRNLAKSVTVE